jgi:transcriptional regulator with XRE-family HTH domain
MIPMQIMRPDYPTNPITFGEKLRKKRMDAGLTIIELASIIGVSADTIINWEIRNIQPMNKKMPTLTTFMSEEN